MFFRPICATFVVAGMARPTTPPTQTVEISKNTKNDHFQVKNDSTLDPSIHVPGVRTYLSVHWGVPETHLYNICCRRPDPATIGHFMLVKLKKWRFLAKKQHIAEFSVAGNVPYGCAARPQSV